VVNLRDPRRLPILGPKSAPSALLFWHLLLLRWRGGGLRTTRSIGPCSAWAALRDLLLCSPAASRSFSGVGFQNFYFDPAPILTVSLLGRWWLGRRMETSSQGAELIMGDTFRESRQPQLDYHSAVLEVGSKLLL
jgi:hypothetical protein